MNFELTEEQRLIQHAAREFARREIQPIAAQCDREALFPMQVFDQARELGLVNMSRPTQPPAVRWRWCARVIASRSRSAIAASPCA